MQRSRAILKNNRGIALILAVVMLGILLSSFIAISLNYFSNFTAELDRERNRIWALEALQSFATLAQTAHANFMPQPPGAAFPAICKPGTNQSPPGRPFCWGNTTCINNPHANSISAPNQLCLGGNLNLLSLDLTPKYRYGRMVAQIAGVIENFGPVMTLAARDMVGRVAGVAYAQSAPWLPALGAVPTANINVLNCGPGFPANTYCKWCSLPQQNVKCIELRVCLYSNNCPNYDDWFAQKVGFIDRY